jgi:hypothetical protein
LVAIFSPRIFTSSHNFRDVGVAGLNPVTPTIEFIRVFSPPLAYGSRYFGVAVPKKVPVFGAEQSLNDPAVLGRRHNPVLAGRLFSVKIGDRAF